MFFALIPTFYTGTKHDDNSEPTYAYTSIELDALTTSLQVFLSEIHACRYRLMAELGESPQEGP